jgi:hypothetical protein
MYSDPNHHSSSFSIHRMEIYRRGKPVPSYSRDKSTGIKCGQCEKDDAKMVSRKFFFLIIREKSILIFEEMFGMC